MSESLLSSEYRETYDFGGSRPRRRRSTLSSWGRSVLVLLSCIPMMVHGLARMTLSILVILPRLTIPLLLTIVLGLGMVIAAAGEEGGNYANESNNTDDTQETHRGGER